MVPCSYEIRSGIYVFLLSEKYDKIIKELKTYRFGFFWFGFGFWFFWFGFTIYIHGLGFSGDFLFCVDGQLGLNGFSLQETTEEK